MFRRSTKRKIKRAAMLLFVAVAVILLAALPALPALAEAAATAAPDTPYDWAALLTIPGATAATLLIVQFIKAPIDTVWKIPTRVLVYAIALIILLCAQAFTTGLTPSAVPLIVVNAFVVALAAMGSYEATFAKIE